MQAGAPPDGRHVSATLPLHCWRQRRRAPALSRHRPCAPCCCFRCSGVFQRNAHFLSNRCRYFHIFAFVSSAIPLALGYPAPAVLPSALEAVLLLGIACGSFGGNLLVS